MAATVFVFAWIALMPLLQLPLAVNLAINVIITIITLLLVLILQNAHRQDIRALQAKLDEFAERQNDAERLSPDELRQVRTLIAGRPEDPDEALRRANRDQRPSLF